MPDNRASNLSLCPPSQLGLSYDDFSTGAPDLHATIASKSKNSKSSKEGEATLVSFDLSKLKMSSGSYGWSGTNKRINVEIEVDGEIKKVQAQVSILLVLQCFSCCKLISCCDGESGHAKYHGHGLEKG